MARPAKGPSLDLMQLHLEVAVRAMQKRCETISSVKLNIGLTRYLIA